MHTQVEVPAEVRAAARNAFALREPDARVLDLLTDTLVDDPIHDGPRRLRFLDVGQGADVTVLVRERPGTDLVRLEIAVEPATAFVEEVRNGSGCGGLHEVSPGRWHAGPLRHGLTSVVIGGTGARLRTAWVRV